MKRKAQIAMQFSWIYIAIAGGIILLFFVMIVMRQKDASETELSRKVSLELESIFIGASQAKKETNVIETFTDDEIIFTCDRDGYSEFRLSKSQQGIELPIQPIVTPYDIKSAKIVTWTLEYYLPFKTTNIMIVHNPNTRLVVVYDPDNIADMRLFEKRLPDEFKAEFISYDRYTSLAPSEEEQVRFVFLNRYSGGPLPAGYAGFRDIDVTGVTVSGGGAEFFRKEGNRFESLGQTMVLRDFGSDQAGLFLAAFSKDLDYYKCTLKKILARLRIVAGLYGRRNSEVLVEYTQIHPDSLCDKYLDVGMFDELSGYALECNEIIDDACIQWIGELGMSLEEENEKLNLRTNCPLLY